MKTCKTMLKRAAQGLMLGALIGLTSCASPPAPPSSKAAADKAAVNQLLQQAYTRALSKNDSAAEVLLLQAQKLEPANPWVALNLGALYQRNGHRDFALKQYQRVLESPDAQTAGQVSAGEVQGATPAALARANTQQMELWAAAPPAMAAATERKRVTLGAEATPGAHSLAQGASTAVAAAPASALMGAAAGGTTVTATTTQATATPLGATEQQKQEQELSGVLNTWRQAWAGLDLEGYLRHYHSSFKGDKATREAWVASRRSAFARNAKALQIRVYDPVFEIKGQEAQIRFKQEFESAAFYDSGTKVLRLVLSEGQWKINKETFIK